MAKEGADEVEELLEEVEEGICRNNQHGCSAFLSEEHRVEVQLRKPVEDAIQLHLSAHNNTLGNPRVFSRQEPEANRFFFRGQTASVYGVEAIKLASSRTIAWM